MVQQLLQQHLHRAQQYMKTQADKKRTHRVFPVGDQVFLKLQPYVQTSVATRACHKLAFRFFGPYKIIHRINDVAYELQLPAHSQVHPIFHVSQLRRALLPGTQASADLPITSDIPIVPVAVLQRQWRKRRGRMIEQVLIRWSNRDAVDDTWEDCTELQARFPDAEAWGQASSQEGGDVRVPDMTGPPAAEPRPTRQRKPNPLTSGPEWVNKPRLLNPVATEADHPEDHGNGETASATHLPLSRVFFFPNPNSPFVYHRSVVIATEFEFL